MSAVAPGRSPPPRRSTPSAAPPCRPATAALDPATNIPIWHRLGPSALPAEHLVQQRFAIQEHDRHARARLDQLRLFQPTADTSRDGRADSSGPGPGCACRGWRCRRCRGTRCSRTPSCRRAFGRRRVLASVGDFCGSCRPVRSLKGGEPLGQSADLDSPNCGIRSLIHGRARPRAE